MSSRRSRRGFLLSVGAAAAAPTLADTQVSRAGNRYLQERRVLLYECTRKEIREALEQGSLKAAIVPTGSTEQHNEHLAMIHDTASALLVAQKAALQLYPQVIVTTPVSIGISPHWMERKGTLTLRPETFLAVVFDICESLKAHGLKKILILNGHGGNVAAIQVALAEVFNELPGLKVHLENWWRAPEVEAVFDAAFKEPGGHADAGETSAILAIRPDVVRLDRAAFSPDAPEPDFLTVETFLECFPHGVIGGDPTVGSAQVGDQALEASAQVCARWLER